MFAISLVLCQLSLAIRELFFIGQSCYRKKVDRISERKEKKYVYSFDFAT